MLLGALFGALGGGLQSGQFGRKLSLMIDSILFTLATIALSLAPNMIVILMPRFVQGYSHASAIVGMAVYTSEISQPELRKVTGVFAVICISFGAASSMILGKFCCRYTANVYKEFSAYFPVYTYARTSFRYTVRDRAKL